MKHLPPPRRDNARKHPRNPAQQVAAEAALGGLVRRHVTLHFGFSDSPTGGLLDQQMLVAIVSFFKNLCGYAYECKAGTYAQNISHVIDSRQRIPDGDMNNRVRRHEFTGSHFSVVRPAGLQGVGERKWKRARTSIRRRLR
jgi:hypothetical protein